MVPCVYVGCSSLGGGGEWWRLRWGCMVDGLHILIWSGTEKPLGEGRRGERMGVAN
jgi:hypothetical protein